MIKRFVNDILRDDIDEKLYYDAGIVLKTDETYIIANHMIGAEELFSVGEPVYDEDGNLMGYLGVALFDHLNYSTENNVRIPVDYWQICLPTEDCISGKKVFTYWHNKARNRRAEQ